MCACVCTLLPGYAVADVTEFCLDGQFDLGARLQGMQPAAGDRYPARWCVTTEGGSDRALVSIAGHANPDMADEFSLLYLPPDTVRIIFGANEPDLEFRGTANRDEARRVRRLDPRRLVEEWRTDVDVFRGVTVDVSGPRGDERLRQLSTTADLPLRGTVDVVWRWDWDDPDAPNATLTVDDDIFFEATGGWRNVDGDSTWTTTKELEPVVLPGERWPTSIDMSIESVADRVYLVKNVRSGFQHLVVDTSAGLVIGDAPAGWLEFYQVPPVDFVPGLGVSGLSERFVDFLQRELPGRPIHAVVLTHAHDDHAGGARAFAAAGGDIYAPRESAVFLANGLNRENMPADRLAALDRPAGVSPVDRTVELGEASNRVRIVSMGPGPHVDSMLGVWVVDRDIFFVSDVHVPRSDADEPASSRAKTECWFARWATTHLPADTIVINSHSPVQTPVSRLERYLDSDACGH